MKYPLEALVDACVAELEKGRDLEEILEAHPDVADEIRPLLAAAAWAKIDVPPPLHSRADKRRLMEAVAVRRRVVESVDGYVNEVKAGVPLRDLVARAPQGLRPLVKAAWRMESTPSPTRDPRCVAEGRRLILDIVAERREAFGAAARPTVRSTVAGLEASLREATAGMRLTPSMGRRVRSAMAAVTVVAVLASGMAGVHTAAAGSVPGQTFYAVKRLGESAQLLLAHDAGRRAELNIRFATRRLDEINALAASGRAVPVNLMEEWLRGQSSAWAEIRDLPLAQRQLLAEMLLANVEGGGLSDDAKGAVGSQQSLEEILARSSALAEAVRDSLGATTATPEEALHDSGPMAVERPLPLEDVEAPPIDSSPPAAEAPVHEVAPEAPVAAPVVDAPADRHDEDKPDEPVAEPPPEEPAAEPPAFGAPPIAPEPLEPGAGGSAGPGGEPAPAP